MNKLFLACLSDENCGCILLEVKYTIEPTLETQLRNMDITQHNMTLPMQRIISVFIFLTPDGKDAMFIIWI